MSHVPVSVLIPCFNSADVIEECLRSVSWADEIFVCDSFSTDATLDFCRRYTERIVRHEYVNSATQKNWAIPQVAHDGVLIVDTDERVSPELRREIEAVLTPDCPYDGFRIPRLNHVFGRPIRHGGHYPDYQLRLFRRDRGRYQDRQVHAHVELQGTAGVLSAPLLHHGQRDVEQVTRVYLLRYTAWEAAQKQKDGVRFRPTDLVVRPAGAFALRYLKQRGFLDGTAGLFMALLVSAYVFLTYARLWQLQKETDPQPSSPRGRTGPEGAGQEGCGPATEVAWQNTDTEVSDAADMDSPLSRAQGEGSGVRASPLSRAPGERAGPADPQLGAGGPVSHGQEVRVACSPLPRTGEGPGVRASAPLRVGFLVPHTGAGGAEANLRTLLDGVDRSRISPVVFVAGEGPATRLLAGAGVPIVCVPTPRFFSTSFRLGSRLGGGAVFNPLAVAADGLLLVGAALRYARALRRARVRVVHSGSIFAHALGLLAAPLAGARLVWHVQDIVSPRLAGGLVLPVFAWLGARRADLVVCPSEAVAAGLRDHWPDGARGRPRVVHNGLDLSGYDPARPATLRHELGLTDDLFVALHIGRLVPWKGQREFLAAASLVARDQPRARFVVVGDTAFEGPAYRDELHALARRLGLWERVIFTGWRQDIPALLAAADVLVHSSVLPEPFGLVIVEAMAMERPVVASQFGGPAEIVRDGEEGLLVDPRDPAEIARALLRLADDPGARARMGRAGRARAEECFSAARFAGDMSAALWEAAGYGACDEWDAARRRGSPG